MLRKFLLASCLSLFVVAAASPANSVSFAFQARGLSDTAKFYLPVKIEDWSTMFLVDTGATYTTLSRTLLDTIRDKQPAGSQRVELANGQVVEAARYLVPRMRVNGCPFENVQVLETSSQESILGTNELVRLEPFTFYNGSVSITCHAGG